MMKKFCLNIVFVTLLTLALLTAMDFCVTSGLRKSHALHFDTMTGIFKGDINADLIVMGSSRAKGQVNPHMLDSALWLNSYNLGQEGAGFEIQNLIYKLYREHNSKPDYIVHIVGLETVRPEAVLYNHIKFAPYLDHELIKAISLKLPGFDKYDHHMPFARYIGFPDETFHGFANFLGIEFGTNDREYKGFRFPMEEWTDIPFLETVDGERVEERLAPDPGLMSEMSAYLKECKKEGIEVVLVWPPNYYETLAYLPTLEAMKNVFESYALEFEIPFLYYSYDSLGRSREYFADYEHLNKKGAEIFSRKLSQDLKKIIQAHGP